MKILKKEKGSIELSPEDTDDLWTLSQIIDSGDLVRGKTTRKIKLGEDSTQVSKKVIIMTIACEKTELSDETLRVLGTVQSEHEDIPKGSHHTIALDVGSRFALSKEQWYSYQEQKLHEATQVDSDVLLVIAMDREEATIGKVFKSKIDILTQLKGEVSKKDFESKKGNFYKEIYEVLVSYDTRYTPNHIIVASPAFFKEDFVKEVSDEALKKKIILATCFGSGREGIVEVLKRDELSKLLSGHMIRKEEEFVSQLMAEIGKEGLATYGFEHCVTAAQAGAVSKLLVSDLCIQKKRGDETFSELEKLMHTVEEQRGSVILISSQHDAGQKLDGIGGIGAILRYRI